MMREVYILAWGLALVGALLRPRSGAILVWFLIWLYPNTLLYGTLPLNIRFDDLFVVAMVVGGLFSPTSRRATTPLFGLACLWALSMTLGETTGLLIAGASLEGVLKTAGKYLYVPFTVFMLYSTVERPEQVRGYSRWLGTAAAAAGLLGILMVHYPGQFSAFVLHSYRASAGMMQVELIEATEEIDRRAGGAVGAIGLASIAVFGSLLNLTLTLTASRIGTRLWSAGTTLICLAALGYTSTRSAIGAFVVAAAAGVGLLKQRGWLLALMAVGACALILEGSVLERGIRRFATFDQGLSGRASIWEEFLSNISPAYLLFGSGQGGTKAVMNATVHNTYLGAFVYGGLLGVAVFVLSIRKTVRLGLAGRRLTQDPETQGMGTFVLLLLLAMLVLGVVGENFQHTTQMQMFFAALTLLDIRLRWLGGSPDQAAGLVFSEDAVVLGGPLLPSKSSRAS